MHNRLTLKTSNNLLYISLTEIEDTFKSNLHSHPNLEILLIIDGKGYIQTTNKKIPVKKSDIIIINENCNHVEITKGLQFYAIGISKLKMFLQETFTEKIIHFSLNDTDYQLMLNLYRLVYSENSNKNKYSDVITKNTVDTILLILVNKFNLLMSELSQHNDDTDLVNSIKDIIENYYYQDFKLTDIANRLSQSISTICHEFKKHTGCSIKQYKIQKQLEEAKSLLVISDMTISQIASLVGFNNASFFTKMYRKYYGVTPKEYKEKQVMNNES